MQVDDSFACPTHWHNNHLTPGNAGIRMGAAPGVGDGAACLKTTTPQSALAVPAVRRGLSQERPALEAGLERVSISQLERKQVNLGIDSLGKIAAILECKISELLMEPAQGESTENLKPGRRNDS